MWFYFSLLGYERCRIEFVCCRVAHCQRVVRLVESCCERERTFVARRSTHTKGELIASTPTSSIMCRCVCVRCTSSCKRLYIRSKASCRSFYLTTKAACSLPCGACPALLTPTMCFVRSSAPWWFIQRCRNCRHWPLLVCCLREGVVFCLTVNEYRCHDWSSVLWWCWCIFKTRLYVNVSYQSQLDNQFIFFLIFNNFNAISVVGDAVNLAARLMARAAVGDVLVDGDTERVIFNQKKNVFWLKNWFQFSKKKKKTVDSLENCVFCSRTNQSQRSQTSMFAATVQLLCCRDEFVVCGRWCTRSNRQDSTVEREQTAMPPRVLNDRLWLCRQAPYDSTASRQSCAKYVFTFFFFFV